MGGSPTTDRTSTLFRWDARNTRLKSVQFRLTRLSPKAGDTIVVDRPMILGSDAAADVVLTESGVSRRHAALEPSGQGLTVRDLGSTNGTFVGALKIQQVTIGDDAVIRLGETKLRLEVVVSDLAPTQGVSQFGKLTSQNAAMRSVFSALERAAPGDASIVLVGETGVGKGLLAEGVHQLSPRRSAPLVTVDCAALTESLVDSHLFGYVRGAFTGADSDRLGAFQQAHGGTILLDNVHELPRDVQPKLLRALQAKTIRRLGDEQETAIDVRVLATASGDLNGSVAKGNFREDLYYRLAVLLVEVPPLRQRPEDIPVLVEAFLREEGRADFALPPDLLAELCGLAWPGNVRELRNVVQRSWAVGDASLNPAASAELPFKDAKQRVIDQFTRAYLATLKERHAGNLSQMAKAAGIERHHLRSLLERLGLKAKIEP